MAAFPVAAKYPANLAAVQAALRPDASPAAGLAVFHLHDAGTGALLGSCSFDVVGVLERGSVRDEKQ